MKTRLSRASMALLLLAAAWPPVAHLAAVVLVAVTAFAAAHPAVVLTVAAAVLLAGTVPGPVERTLSRLATARPVSAAAGGGKR